MATRTGQKMNGYLLEIQSTFSEIIIEKFSTAGIYQHLSSCMLVNMDETAVLYEPKENWTVRFKRENTILIKNTGRNSRQMTVCVKIESTRANLSLFPVIKGRQGGRIEFLLSSNSLPNTSSCRQK